MARMTHLALLAALVAAACPLMLEAQVSGGSGLGLQTVGPTVPGYACKYNPANYNNSGVWYGDDTTGVYYLNSIALTTVLGCATQCTLTLAGSGHDRCNAFTFSGLQGQTTMTTTSYGSCALYTITSASVLPTGQFVVPIFSYLSTTLGIRTGPPVPPSPPSPPPAKSPKPINIPPIHVGDYSPMSTASPSSPTRSPSPTPKASPSPAPVPTPTPTPGASPSPKPKTSPSPSATPSPTTSSPSPARSPSPTPAPSPMPTPSPVSVCGRTDTYTSVACCPTGTNAVCNVFTDPTSCVKAETSVCATPIKADGSGGGLTSMNGKYSMTLDAYGNIVLSAKNGGAYWKSYVVAGGIGYNPSRIMILRNDGLILLVSGPTNGVYSTDSTEGYGYGAASPLAPYKLVMQNTGDLAIIDKSNATNWSALMSCSACYISGQGGPKN